MRAHAAGEIGKRRHSKSGRDLPVGRPRRIFDRTRALELRRAGKSIREIACALRVGRGTVERLLLEARAAAAKRNRR
jgi:DNA invertase Pin-like site-specific DNA recombinase